MGYKMITKNGYDFFEVSSAMQKAIRRGESDVAGYFAIELFESGYHNYAWKRLLTVSAEDCYGVITHEIKALYDSFIFINKGAKKPKGRIFLAKATILLSLAVKSRDADHLTNLIYDKKKLVHNRTPEEYLALFTEEQIEKHIDSIREDLKEIPEYAYDVHTLKGKRMGKTKEGFIKEEYEALKPKQVSIWELDDLL